MSKAGLVGRTLLVLGLAGLNAWAWADAAGAAAAFKLGQQYQGAKQWGAAVKEYQAALKADPRYYPAYKALGTTYYQAGDRKGALVYYDRYLAMNPADTATKAFADKLRAQLGGAAPAAAATPAGGAGTDAAAGTVAASTGKFRPGWSAGLGAGIVMTDGSDVAKFYAGAPSTVKAPGGAMALGFDLAAGYAFAGGTVLDFQVVLGPNRTHTADNSVGSFVAKETWAISHMGFFISPGYRFKMGDSWWLEPHVGLGYLTATLADTLQVGGGGSSVSLTTTYPGSGFAAWPELRVVKNFGSFDAVLGLGYFWSTAGPFKNPNTLAGMPGTSGNLQYYAAGATTGTDWMMSTTGLSARLGLAYHFSPPF